MKKVNAVPISELLETLYADMPPYQALSDMLQAQVSTTIANERIDRKMNQKQFAEYMGVTQSQVSKWENGCFNFTVEKLCEIADKLGLSCIVRLEKKGVMRERTGNIIPMYRIDADHMSSSRYKDTPISLAD